MPAPVLLATAAEVADLLRLSEKTFRNQKPTFRVLGFPEPLDIPGDAKWEIRAIEDWIASRRRAEPAPPKRVLPPILVERNAKFADTPRPLLDGAARRGRGRPRKPAASMEGGAA